MKTRSLILMMVLAIVMSAGLVDAAGGKKTKPTRGKITKIDGKDITIAVKASKTATDTTDTVVTATDATVITIKGETKTLADLAVGQMAVVTLDTDGKTALTITEGKAPTSAPATAPAPDAGK